MYFGCSTCMAQGSYKDIGVRVGNKMKPTLVLNASSVVGILNLDRSNENTWMVIHWEDILFLKIPWGESTDLICKKFDHALAGKFTSAWPSYSHQKTGCTDSGTNDSRNH
ncbi:hypothetical protein SUGI_0007650 [Cryptomeria japonica]|nr:hypothetical protein SUGI_0007650 [Cryptomeria japonica]